MQLPLSTTHSVSDPTSPPLPLRACPQIRGAALILGLVSSELETRIEDFCEEPDARNPLSIRLTTFTFTLGRSSPRRICLLLDTRSQFTGKEMRCRCNELQRKKKSTREQKM
ncbi:hypothetical protein Pelo_12016 [Pelomyxa schiedti]|nr:hypothetical protein Pelo_12016 [Pelomyxa schiedti]